LRNKMRVGQVSDIKQEFKVRRAPVFVTEAQDLHAHWRASLVRTESFNQLTAQRVHRVFGRVNDLIGKRANALHRPPFIPNSLRQTLLLVSRMWPAGLTKTVLQHVARSFEKQYVDPQPAIAQYL